MISLQKLCLDFVAKNFEKYNFVLNDIKDRSLQRNFEFLQRRFSVQLAKTMYEKKKLKDEYFHFLINEHLTFLDGKWFKNSHFLNCMENIFSRLPNLTRICCDGFDDKIVNILVKFCPEINEMDMKHSNITDNGIEYLCVGENEMLPFPKLKNIFLEFSHVTDEGVIRLIQTLPLLERVYHPNVASLLHSIHEKTLSECKKVHYYNLVHLKLPIGLANLSNYIDVLKTCFAVCPKLESLDLFILNEEQLNCISNCRLKSLVLFGLQFEEKINVDNFLKQNGSGLINLKLYYCTISVSLLAVHCPILKDFIACKVNFTHDDEVKSNFPSLIQCALLNTDFSANESACLLFSSSPKLKTIYFYSCILNNDLITGILLWCKNPSAEKIACQSLNVEVKFLKDILLHCPSLKEMHLRECSFDVQDPKEVLCNFANSLCNKPHIYIE